MRILLFVFICHIFLFLSLLQAQDRHDVLLWGNVHGDFEIENSEPLRADVAIRTGVGYFVIPKLAVGLGGSFEYVPNRFLPGHQYRREMYAGVMFWTRYYLPYGDGLRWYAHGSIESRYERRWGRQNRDAPMEDLIYDFSVWIPYTTIGVGFSAPIKSDLLFDFNLAYQTPIQDPGFDVFSGFQVQIGIVGILNLISHAN